MFGKLVGGLDTLTEMEKIEVDNKDRPIENIVLEKAQVFTDPFQEAEEELAKERAEDLANRQKQAEEDAKKMEQKRKPLKAFRTGVGKYLNLSELGASTSKVSVSDPPPQKKKKDVKSTLGDFSSW